MSTTAEQETASKYDLEHTYEFVNKGEPWTRTESKHLGERERIIETGGHFRALGAELDEIEDAPERFEHTRTLPYPPKDETTAMRPMRGMQRREAPRSTPTGQQYAAQVKKDAQKAEREKQKGRKKAEK
jgi:hypothetical protein